MSEPFELYNADGSVVKMYSPKVAEELVEAGKLFECPPLVEEKTSSPQPKPRVTRKKKEEE